MRRDTRIAASVFIAIPVIIVGSATLCTWVIAQGAAMKWRLAFRVLCHGIVARCVELWGVPMPICARCLGIYAGLFFGLATFVVWPFFTERILRLAAVVAFLPLAIDGITQAMQWRESTNDLRLATGMAAGFALGMWALSAIEDRRHTALTLP